ncbi:hypothetical protein Sango_1509400 [Sesamum angolense]|uniref:FAF domain-containing protein n=1 Tax=Sesamum angolense TaxID=2727404 RepID=A0AAE1WND5_9LAMI|nr:hypothetical protein Sango_1509400 [Sesamum angolense]
MAACGGLEHIFEKPLPESPRILEPLPPWKQIQPINTVNHSSFTEIYNAFFRQNHANDHPDSPTYSFSPFSPPSYLSSNSLFSTNDNVVDIPKNDENGGSGVRWEKNTSGYCLPGQHKQYIYRDRDSSSSMNSENLSLCTEGLGLESFDELENLLRIDFCNNGWQRDQEERTTSFTRKHKENTRAIVSFREDGRFILKEIRIPTQELLHACRENGHLKLQFIQPDDEASEEEANYKYVEENNKHTGKKGRNQDEEGEDQNVEKSNCNGAREYANKKL